MALRIIYLLGIINVEGLEFSAGKREKSNDNISTNRVPVYTFLTLLCQLIPVVEEKDTIV